MSLFSFNPKSRKIDLKSATAGINFESQNIDSLLNLLGDCDELS